MNRCPITYKALSPDARYSKTGLHKLNTALKNLQPFPLNKKNQIQEAQKRMTKMSIAGVQPKLSAQLSVKDQTFKIVDKNGSYILKPELTDYDQVRHNEDLTMRMADVCGIEVPFHGLVYARDHSMLFFIRRFDRVGHTGKIHVEDFAQVAGMSRETKYNYSMEKIITLIERYCTFPMVEKMKLYRRVLFCWLTGNEDMHLKNFSLIHRQNKIELSPAYDLLNTTMVMPGTIEEMALPLQGKKSNFNHSILSDYFGYERLGLNKKILTNIETKLKVSLPRWKDLIAMSFLDDQRKEQYLSLLEKRVEVLGW